MSRKVSSFIDSVGSRQEAQVVIADLLQRFGSDVAIDRMSEYARAAKQSVDRTAVRVAGNLLSSFVVHRPSGQVSFIP